MRISGVLGVPVAALVLVAAPALASHDDDDLHSDNARLVAELKLGWLAEAAFWGDLAIVGHLGEQNAFGSGESDGFSVVDVSEPEQPRVVSTYRCTGGGLDVSVWKHLVLLSVDGFRASDGPACDAAPEGGFSGIKIVSIADPANPRDVGAVPMPCSGSHTHTLVPDLEHRDGSGATAPRLLVYASSVSSRAHEGSAGGCDPIAEVPLAHPGRARTIGTVPGDELQSCHDITVFLPRRLAAGACQSTLRIYDIGDPAAPTVIGETANPFNEFHHSVAFSNDGRRLAVGEEGSRSTCPGGTGAPVGALWFYDLSDPTRPLLQGYHQVGRPTRFDHGCSSHQFATVPMRGDRDLLTVGWYSAGMSLVDWTDPTRPRELSWYVADPSVEDRSSVYWAAYWYRGHAYATNMFSTARQTLDVVRITEPALQDAIALPHFNAQTQEAPLEAAQPVAERRAERPASKRSRRRGCAPFALRIHAARRIRSAVLRDESGHSRRLQIRGRTVLVAGRGTTVRVRYVDRRGRRRTAVRRVGDRCG